MNTARNAAGYTGAMSAADSRTIVIDTDLLPLEIAAQSGTTTGAITGMPTAVGTSAVFVIT